MVLPLHVSSFHSMRPIFRLALIALLGAISHAQPAAELADSFEDGVPATIAASGGKLSVSTERVQDGKQSLRWDFSAGDAIVIRTGPLGNVNMYTGYGGYSRSSLTLPI